MNVQPPREMSLSADRLTMYSPLSAIVRREPIAVGLDATIREALEVMDRARVGSVIVEDGQAHIPLGIFTARDLLRRVILPGGDLRQPIASVMTSGLVTLTEQATAHEAALTMARNGVTRVIVVDRHGRLVGVVSETDLFAMHRIGLTVTSNEIREAVDLDGLRRAAQGIRRFAGDLIAQGTDPEALTHAISTLTDLLTIRIIDLMADEHDPPPVPICWIALGAEGRLEQTFTTDQDNALIFDAEAGAAEHVRQALMPFAAAVNRALDACGFGLCKGNVVASNARWCLRVVEWQRAFSRWIHEPDPEGLLHAAIFFDFRPVYGDHRLADQLREWLQPVASENPLFLRLMAENALRAHPPLGTFRDFVYDRSDAFPHTIDLKTHGSRIFVDAARVLGLAHQLRHTSTAQRLRAAAAATGVGSESFAAIVDGFHFIHRLRLRIQCGRDGPAAAANRIDPRELNELDRQMLRHALWQARKLQSRLAADHDLRV